ncbi:TPA: hypothetical protein N0F65_006235 [Lagenidium giganteum]|uniref:BZIP domain-containing protein n=1 Tax=Lagenidium giganteum TaxID=4803 RepID=A0AAV2Z6G0_9STRA|nr:TPA: hypothetical protein N0F65_006235 [Lagenidium giganteum]
MAVDIDCSLDRDAAHTWWPNEFFAIQGTPASNGTANADFADESARTARRRQQLIECARRNRTKKKREREQLVEQVKELSDNVETLRIVMQARDKQSTSSTWQEQTLVERRKLAQAMHDNASLRGALFRLCGYVHELRSVFSSAPTRGGIFSLLEMLHSYTHLGRNNIERQRRLSQVCSDAQLGMMQQVICRETEQFDCRKSVITTRNWSTADRFGSNHCGLLLVDGSDLSAVFEAVRESVKMAAQAWPHHHQSMCVLEPISATSDELYYGRATVHYRHEHAARGDEGEVIIASDTIYCSRLMPTYGIILIDFVDADDLLPATDRCHFRRDHVGG